jgi:hypothetical protein
MQCRAGSHQYGVGSNAYFAFLVRSLASAISQIGRSGRTVRNRLFGLHSLAFPFELYLNASQGANPAYVAIFELAAGTTSFAASAKLSAKIACFR